MIGIYFDSIADKIVFTISDDVREDGIVVKSNAFSKFQIDRTLFLQKLWDYAFFEPDFLKFIGTHPENYMELNVKLDFITSSLPDEEDDC